MAGSRSWLVAAVLAALPVAVPSPVTGQQRTVVPAGHAELEGLVDAHQALGHSRFRYQQVWRGDAFEAGRISLRAISFRADGETPPWKATRLPHLRILAARAAHRPYAMHSRFDANVGGEATVVFDGPLDVPAAPRSAGHAFTIRIPFARQHTFETTTSDLLLEFVGLDNVDVRNAVVVDAHRRRDTGEARRFGIAGRFGGGQEHRMLPLSSVRDAVPGGHLEIGVDLPRPWVGFTIVGASPRIWQGLRLPLDLHHFGAPGNSLLVGGAITAMRNPIAHGNGWRSTLRLDLPDNPWLVDRPFYAQAVHADPAANALGLVFSDALLLAVGRGTSTTRTLFAPAPTATHGVFFLAEDGGGPIVEFEHDRAGPGFEHSR